MSHLHHDSHIEHDVRSDCCVCCNNSPKSIDMARLDRYYEKAQSNGFYGGLLTPQIYEATKLEIDEYYISKKSEKENGRIDMWLGPKLFSTLYQIELNEGSANLSYSN